MTSQDLRIEAEDRLPEGWHLVSLRDIIIEAQPGFACGTRSPDGVIQLRMNNIDTRGNFVWNEFLRVPVESEIIKKYEITEGDILFNNTNSVELVGKSAMFRGYPEPVVYSNHFTRIRVDKSCNDPSYLASWLILQHKLGIFTNLCNRWVGQSAVKKDQLFTLSIPLPPTLEQQKRIASILGEQLAAVKKARAAGEARLEAAKALANSYLWETFGSPEAEKWPKKLLGEVCSVKGGKRLPKGTNFANEITKFPYIRVIDFKEGTVDLSEIQYLEEEVHNEISRYIINYEDVYISIAGTIGVTGVIPKVLDGANLTENAARLIIRNKDELYRDYVARFLQSSIGQEAISQRTNVVGQPKPALERIKTIEIPMPSLSTQQSLTVKLNEHIGESNQLVQLLHKELEAINALSGSLLRKAFSGGL